MDSIRAFPDHQTVNERLWVRTEKNVPCTSLLARSDAIGLPEIPPGPSTSAHHLDP